MNANGSFTMLTKALLLAWALQDLSANLRKRAEKATKAFRARISPIPSLTQRRSPRRNGKTRRAEAKARVKTRKREKTPVPQPLSAVSLVNPGEEEANHPSTKRRA